MRLPFTQLALIALLLSACGAQLDNGVSNLSACKQISEALQTVCTGVNELQWVNCDELPGCPGGEVEQADVDKCVSRIEASPACIDAKVVSCEFERLDCQDPAGEIGLPSELTGYDSVCPYIITALNNYGCTHASNGDICQQLLGCSGGVFNFTDILELIKAVNDEAQVSDVTCEQAEETAQDFASANNLRRKYCLPVDDGILD